MSKLGQRIDERLKAVHLSQAELARRVGISQPAINHLIKRGAAGSAHLHKIARELETTPEYLTGETDDPTPGALSDRHREFRGAPAEVEKSDTVELNEFDVRYGLGATYIHSVPVTGVRRVFSRAWIRMFTDSPIEYLFFATGYGDSQEPTIHDRDVILIDTFDKTPRVADKLWAIEIGGLGSIKRLRPTKDGRGMELLCANPDVPNDIAYDDEMQVIGRVAAIFKKT